MARFLRRLAALAAALSLLCSCGLSAPKRADVQFTAMDTFMHLTAYGDSAGKALAAAEQRLLALESQLSVTDPNSEIFTANKAGGQPVSVSIETAELVDFACRMARRTGGAMDPTVYPLVRAWGFTTDQPRIPARAELEALLPLVGAEQVILTETTLTLSPGTMLDLGSVAKGWAGDRLCEDLKQAGISSAILRLGGNIQTIGTKPDGSDWGVGIQDPDSAGMLARLSVHDCAVVTSGGYQRAFTENGETYWHIIDPATGYPARAGLTSVTVVAPSGALCDALSTALFVMGSDKAADHWREHRDFEAVFVHEGGTVTVTAGLEGRFALMEAYADREVTVLR